MKKYFAKLLLLIPLALVAGASFAAYTFVAPTAAPTANNTDGPLDISATDQIKNGGLAVNTFQSRTGSQFVQQTQFTGLVNGGTASSTSSKISFGNASDITSINHTGSIAITNSYQSDSLKTGGGNKPICADANGTFYLCGATVPTGTTSTPIYLYPNLVSDGNGGYYANASISEPITSSVTVTISATTPGAPGTVNPLSYLKSAFTANARAIGVCYYTSTPTVVGTVTIYSDNSTSWNTVPIPQGCNSTNTALQISSYSPQSTKEGRSIKAAQ